MGQNDCKKYIFGINNFTKIIKERIEIDGVIDEFTNDETYDGIPIIHNLSDVDKKAIVLNNVLRFPVTAQRKLNNNSLLSIDTYSLCHYSNIFNINSFNDYRYIHGFELVYDSRKNEFDTIFDRMSDKESKDIFQRLVCFKKNFDLEQMFVFEDRQIEQYFEDFLNLKEEGEVFVDVGGYDGKTSLDFITKCPKYSKIYYFEPEKDLMAKSKLKLKDFSNIQFVEAGAFSKDGIVKFNSDDSSSSICEDGEQQIEVVKIDTVCDVEHPVSFIKMDIEGAERDAILGARQVIMRDHPRLAICVYHRLDDFIEIPSLVMSIRSDYDIYMRHYTERLVETVMFFIPKKDN